MIKTMKIKEKANLEIVNIEGKGREEVITLVAQAGTNLKNYLIYDTTFTEEGEQSNKGRHIFRFPDYEVEACQEITLKITPGIKIKRPATFYWHRSSPVINDTGDYLVLIEIKSEQQFTVVPK